MPKRLHLLVIAAIVWSAACSSAGDGQVVTVATPGDALPAATEVTGVTSTTVPPPPSTSTTATAPPAPAPAPPTTTTTTGAVPTTTTTTFPPSAVRLTIRNEFKKPVDLTINGLRYLVNAGEVRGPVPVEPSPNGNDTYSIVIAGTDCGMGDAGPHFQEGPGTAVTLRLFAMAPDHGGCDAAGPGVPYLDLAWEGAWSGGH